MKLSDADLNEIKRLDSTCTAAGGDCFLVATAAAAKDMTNSNTLEPKTLAVTDYQQDSVDPELSSFDLNMHTGKLTLVFDETMDVDELKVAQIALHSHADKTNADYQVVTLSAGSSSSSPNGVSVVIDLSTTDLNNIKVNTELAHKVKTTVFLTASATAIKDMNGKTLNAVASKAAGSFIEDTFAPTLESFEFNLNTRTVTLSFSETMKASSLDATKFVLQNAAQSADDKTLRAIDSGEESTSDGAVLNFVFSEADADMIKIRTSLCTTADATGSDCYIRLTADAVTDMNDNAVAEKADGAAIALLDGKFTADDTRQNWRDSIST
jgi:hypothetical protein